MTDKSSVSELNDILIAIHGDVVHTVSPDAFLDAFWNILDSELKSARLLSLVHDLQLQRDDIDRESILAKTEKHGLTELDVQDVAAITTDAELCETVLTRVYPELIARQTDLGRIKAMRLVDHKGRKYVAEIRPVVTSDDEFGWILDATGIPSGALEIEVIEDVPSSRKARRIAGIDIPATLTDLAITTNALAGKSESEASSDNPFSLYEEFMEVRDGVDSDQRLEGDLSGYIVPQPRGARVVMFIPQSRCATDEVAPTGNADSQPEPQLNSDDNGSSTDSGRAVENKRELLHEIVQRCLTSLAPTELEDYDYVFDKVYRVISSTPPEKRLSSSKEGKSVFGGVPFNAAMLTGTTLSVTCWVAYAILHDINEKNNDVSKLAVLDSAIEKMKDQAVDAKIVQEIRRAIIEAFNLQ